MVKESIHQDVPILSMYAPNNGALEYMIQKIIELKGQSNSQI